MSIDKIRSGLAQAKANDGKVDAAELDQVMLEARDEGGISEAEKNEVLAQADGFEDPVQQRLAQHLVATGQAAHVSTTIAGKVGSIEGRYAQMQTTVPGLSAKLSLFDNTFSIQGRATANGMLELSLDGKRYAVDVKAGESPSQILAKLQRQLPAEFASHVFGGGVDPWRAEDFQGRSARSRDGAAHITFYKPAALGLKPGEKPLRVVVTGYGAFHGIIENPSAKMAEKLGQLGVPGGIVEYRRLDVTVEGVRGFMAEMKANPPDVILSMGVSSHSQVEERPENHLGASTDGFNRPYDSQTIREGGPGELKTDLPVDAIDWALDNKFGADRRVGSSKSDPSYSPDRSAYFCNFLGFQLADAFGSTPSTTAGFVHIARDTPPEQMKVLLDAVVSRQLELRRGQS